MSRRKLELLKWINRAGAIRANMLHALDGGNRQNIKVALTELRRAGLICRPEQQQEAWSEHSAFYIYSLAPKGKLMLLELGVIPMEWKAEHQLWHKVMVADIVTSFELIARKRGLSFKTQQAIIGDKPLSLNAGKITHPKSGATYDRPLFADALIAIADTYLLIEADRNTESILRPDFKTSSYLRKLLQYREVFKSKTYMTEWGIPSLFVLHISISPDHTKNILRFAEAELNAKSRANLFKGISMLGHRTRTVEPITTLADEPWERAGHGPHILQL